VHRTTISLPSSKVVKRIIYRRLNFLIYNSHTYNTRTHTHTLTDELGSSTERLSLCYCRVFPPYTFYWPRIREESSWVSVGRSDLEVIGITKKWVLLVGTTTTTYNYNNNNYNITCQLQRCSVVVWLSGAYIKSSRHCIIFPGQIVINSIPEFVNQQVPLEIKNKLTGAKFAEPSPPTAWSPSSGRETVAAGKPPNPL